MNPQLTTRLRHLRLSGMVEALPGRVAQAEAAPLPHLEFLELLVEDELARRADRLFARRLKQAGITTMKTLADFDWTFNPKIPKTKIVELASARFVETHSGILLIGPPGVGKSHIATAIATGAIRGGRRALVRSTFDLAADFAEAEATGERRDLVQQLTRVDLLVLEDFGMKKLASNAAEDLLEVFVRRHETASTLRSAIVSGPRPVSTTPCAASTIFAGERQLFLPAKGQQRSPAHHLAVLGGVFRAGILQSLQRRSAN
jgi:DNA replication protein DnaC